MSVPVQEYLKSRRARALGSILRHAEQSEWWQRMPRPEQEALRRSVLDAVNTYHDSVLDLVKAEDTNVVRNDEVVALLERIDRNTRKRQAAVSA